MSLTASMMLLSALVLAVVLLAAVAAYWHGEAKDWMYIALAALDELEEDSPL